MPIVLPVDPEVVHDHEVWKATAGSVLLPSSSIKARHLSVGREVDSRGNTTYYYEIIFNDGVFRMVHETFDAGPTMSAGDLVVLLGPLTLPAGAPAPPMGPPYLGTELIPILDFIKGRIATNGPRGEIRLAKDCQVLVKKGAAVHVLYHTKTTAEEASEFAICNPCPL